MRSKLHLLSVCLPAGVLVLLPACGGGEASTGSSANSPASSNGAPADEPEVPALARRAIHAWARADFVELASLSQPEIRKRIEETLLSDPAKVEEARERMQRADGPKGATYARTKAWDGKIRGIRYRHFVGTGRDEYVANVWFETLGEDDGEEELLVATLVREGGQWYFDDMHSPTKSAWLEGREEFVESAESY